MCYTCSPVDIDWITDDSSGICHWVLQTDASIDIHSVMLYDKQDNKQ